MAEPFRDRSDRRQGHLAGVGAGRRKKLFIERCETLLGRAEKITSVDAAAMRDLAEESGIDLRCDLTTVRRSFYRRYLEYCLNDYALSADESADLSHLQELLELDDSDVRFVYQEVVRSVYGKALDDVLEDYHLDPAEESFLRRLRKEIGLGETDADDLLSEGKERARQRFLRETLVHSASLVADKRAEIELKGESETGLDGAIVAAIDSAREVVPELRSALLSELRVETRDGVITRWHVTLRALL